LNSIEWEIETWVLILQIKKEVSRKRVSESTIQEIVLDTVQTFVASCPHCPEHRREFILKELLLAIDAEEYLGEYDLFSHLFIHLPIH